MDNAKLLGFPLFVMFMITLVNVGSFTGSSSESFFGTRTVTDNQAELFDNFVQSSYDNNGEDPNLTSRGGNWGSLESLQFIGGFTILQDSEFGVEEGHSTISSRLLQFMRDVFDENAVRVNENDVRGQISVDPVSLAEWQELNASQLTISDTLVFIGIFFGIVVLIGIIGIRIFGVGLAEISIIFIIRVTLFLLIWGLLSIFASSALQDFPVVGASLWIVLTFIYAIGVFLNLSGSNGGND